MVWKLFVVRALNAVFDVGEVVRNDIECRVGLLPPRVVNVVMTTYRVRNTQLLVQLDDPRNGWFLIEEGAVIKFNDGEALGPKLCPGAVHLDLIEKTDESVTFHMVREGCWEEPPSRAPFCPKHFNTRYGQYVRYVFGSGKPNPDNPFFHLPALLYAVFYGGDRLKVGTTIIIKGLRRFLEQPVYLVALLKLCRNIGEARELEVWFSKSSRLFSQAPSMKFRIGDIIRSLMRKDLARDTCKFVRSLILAVTEATSRRGRPGSSKSLADRLWRKLSVINVTHPDLEEELLKSRVAVDVSMAGKVLAGRAAEFLGIVRGFILLGVDSAGNFAVPYEVFRDRLTYARVTS